jgi:hypothetical protein
MLRDELVRHDLLHFRHGRREQLRRLLRAKPLSLGVGEQAAALVSRAALRVASEHRHHSITSLVGEEMPVAFSHCLGRVTEKIVDHSLVDPLPGEVRGEAVTKDVVSPQDRPLRLGNRSAEDVLQHMSGEPLVRLTAEQQRAAGMFALQPLSQNPPDERRHLDLADGLGPLRLFLFSEPDIPGLEVHVPNLYAGQFAHSCSGVGGGGEQRVEKWHRPFPTPNELQQFSDLSYVQEHGIPECLRFLTCRTSSDPPLDLGPCLERRLLFGLRVVEVLE